METLKTFQSEKVFTFINKNLLSRKLYTEFYTRQQKTSVFGGFFGSLLVSYALMTTCYILTRNVFFECFVFQLLFNCLPIIFIVPLFGVLPRILKYKNKIDSTIFEKHFKSEFKGLTISSMAEYRFRKYANFMTVFNNAEVHSFLVQEFVKTAKNKRFKVNISNTVAFLIFMLIFTTVLDSFAKIFITDKESFIEWLKIGMLIFFSLIVQFWLIAHWSTEIFLLIKNRTSNKYYAAAKFIEEFKINAKVLGLLNE